MDRERFEKGFQEILARCWTDSAFKQRFMSDPKRVFAEHGVDVPPGVEVHVVENTDRRVYITLPPPPSAAGELTDSQLDTVAGGGQSGSYNYGAVYNIFTSSSGAGGGFVPVLPHPGPGSGG